MYVVCFHIFIYHVDMVIFQPVQPTPHGSVHQSKDKQEGLLWPTGFFSPTTQWVHQRPLMQRSSKLQLQLPWSSGNLVGSSVLPLPHQQPHPPSFLEKIQRENSRPSPMKELDSWSSTNPSLGRLRGCNAGGRRLPKNSSERKGYQVGKLKTWCLFWKPRICFFFSKGKPATAVQTSLIFWGPCD